MEFIPARLLDDGQLRHELAELHRLEPAVQQKCVPSQREALRVRLAELDREYLRRFPSARERWPWNMNPATGEALP